jgi:hypothetical protein
MNIKNIYKTATFVIIILSVFGCKKDYGPSLQDAISATPVTVQNQKYFERLPYVETSISGGGVVEVVLAIPETSPRTIKEVSRVTLHALTAAVPGGTPAFNASTIQNPSSYYNYITAPIAGSGKTVTFKTSISEFLTKRRLTLYPRNTNALAIVPNQDMQMFFLVTLDDNSTVIPVETRCRVQN